MITSTLFSQKQRNNVESKCNRNFKRRFVCPKEKLHEGHEGFSGGRIQFGWWEERSHFSQSLHNKLSAKLQVRKHGILKQKLDYLDPIEDPWWTPKEQLEVKFTGGCCEKFELHSCSTVMPVLNQITVMAMVLLHICILSLFLFNSHMLSNCAQKTTSHEGSCIQKST